MTEWPVETRERVAIMHDDESDVWPEREQHIFEEKVEREGGVFIEPQHTQEDCNNPEDFGCGTDEYPEDPYAVDNRTGTIDDLTYDFGVELPNAADQHLIPEGRTHQSGRPAPSAERDLPAGQLDEDDLWQRQQALIEEDEGSPTLPAGADADEARIRGAMGDDEGDEAQEDASETSATGYPTTGAEGGGFAEKPED